jgi:hypothetical protein
MLRQDWTRRLSRPIAASAIAALFVTSVAAAQDEMPSQAEMWRIIQQQAQMLESQAKEIKALKTGQQAIRDQQSETQVTVRKTQETLVTTQEQVAETQEQVVATVEAVESASSGATLGSGGGWWDRTSVGGYGELHYEGGTKDEIDFHRFVLFVGHEFNNRIRFFSEIELEHALSKDTADGSGPGEVELEQAYLQFDLDKDGQHRANAGIQLLPVGILNETHEPPTFYGVERNQVETNIIPSTWWEAGIGIAGNLGETGFSYDIVASSGLEVPLTGGNAFKIRNGRQKVAKAPAKAPAVTGRIRYTGIPGVEVAASAQHQFDVTQGAGDPITGQDVAATLFTTHIDAERNGFGLRALYASWWLEGATPDMLGRDRQTGFYVEPSYKFPLYVHDMDLGEIGFFYRYSEWDNNAGLSTAMGKVNRHVTGLNYWPHPDVVIKADYYWEDKETGATDTRFNLGAGFQF